MQNNLSAQIKEKALELGYDLCGIIQADTFQEFIDGLDKRVEQFPRSIHLYEGLYSLANPLEKAEWGEVYHRMCQTVQQIYNSAKP